jgi:uncharacterized protein
VSDPENTENAEPAANSEGEAGGESGDDSAAAPAREFPSGRVFLIAFGLIFAINVADQFARDALALTILGLLFAPLIGGACVMFAGSCVHDLRNGRWAHGGLGLLLLIAPLLFVGSGVFARQLMFPGCPDGLPAADTELAPGVTVLDYDTADGITLRGVLARGTGPAPRPGVVYFHGNAESAVGSQGLATRLSRLNLDVLIAEFRGYGGCKGSPSQAGLLADGRAAIAALEAQTGSPPTLLFGRSIGTGLTTSLAAEGHGKAVLLLSPYTSILSLAERIVTPALARLALRDNFDSLTNLAACTHPVTIFHGTEDQVIPYALGKELAESLGERGRLVTLRGTGHNDVFNAAGGRILAEAARLARDAQ